MQEKKILIVGDYDADGILSTAIMVRFFESIGVRNFSYVIPNRFKDGYGISEGVLARYEGVDLIITVDNGITALEVAKECKKRGQTLIITDHHSPKDELPDALIINPKVSGFAQEEICGCLVAWYFCAGIKQVLGVEFDLGSLLEFVGIAIISDVMPLLEINRTLLKQAIKKYPTSTYPCFEVLRGVYKNIDAEVINVRFLKPLDVETLKKSIEKTKKVITIEDGTIINGLGTAIKELIVDHHIENVKIKTYAYPDKFIQHGSVDELENIYHLDEDSIVEDIQKHIVMKLIEKKGDKIDRENKDKEETIKQQREENKEEEKINKSENNKEEKIETVKKNKHKNKTRKMKTR